MKNGWITDNFGNKFHYVNDMLHNDNGPAIIYNDESMSWFKNGLRHREDGPAIKWASDLEEWWYKRKYVSVKSQKEFETWKKCRAFL